MKFKGFLVKHNRIFIPVISIIPSALIFYMSVYIPELIILIFAIPVIIFLLMHFLNIHTFKPRLFGGFAILLIVLLISSGFYTNSLYLSGGVSHNTVNGTYMETSISPFTEYSGEYNITSLTNYTGSLKNANITIISSTHSIMERYNSSHAIKKNGYRGFYFDTKLPPGLYRVYFNITTNSGKNISMESIGPVNISEFTMYEYYIYAIAFKYIISLGVLYIAGISIAYFMQKGSLKNK